MQRRPCSPSTAVPSSSSSPWSSMAAVRTLARLPPRRRPLRALRGFAWRTHVVLSRFIHPPSHCYLMIHTIRVSCRSLPSPPLLSTCTPALFALCLLFPPLPHSCFRPAARSFLVLPRPPAAHQLAALPNLGLVFGLCVLCAGGARAGRVAGVARDSVPEPGRRLASRDAVPRSELPSYCGGVTIE